MSAQRFRKKPVFVDAIQFRDLADHIAIVDWMKACGDTHALADEVKYTYPIMLMPTPRGTVAFEPGDWVISDEEGFSRCRNEVFKSTYEAVSSEVREGAAAAARRQLAAKTQDWLDRGNWTNVQVEQEGQ